MLRRFVLAALVVLEVASHARAAGLAEPIQLTNGPSVGDPPGLAILASTPSARSFCILGQGASPLSTSALKEYEKFLGASASNDAAISCNAIIHNVEGNNLCGLYTLTNCKCTAGTCGP
jgi:hypothetical protein